MRRVSWKILGAFLLWSVACENGFVDPNGGVASAKLVVDGLGTVQDRYTAEVWAVGNIAYTTTWGVRAFNGITSPGNAIKIWNVAGNTPVLVDSMIVDGATTVGDVQVSDDGKLLVVPTEKAQGSIAIYDLTNPLKPHLLSQFRNDDLATGVHTAAIQRVNGKLYAFLSVDPSPARLVIVDLSNPEAPTQVFSQAMGNPFVHDVFVRDGILFVALWNDGVSIFDIGGGGKNGTVSAPVLLGNVLTQGGEAHNIWWFHDPVSGSKRYAFVGEEATGSIGAASAGDIHVIDVSNFAAPHEVGFYSVVGAGTHNFSVDESKGILYAAYYNAGVRALDIRGDLGGCATNLKDTFGRCDLRKMGREIGHGLTDMGMPVYVWGVHKVGASLFASDMINGLWKLEALQ
ncbi:MAG TPA: hypothetical protein VM099_13875 [Gemmatimonadaceae bacterium]|nr:hypothetical protein [Gemmatimonadaceae bacterium]